MGSAGKRVRGRVVAARGEGLGRRGTVEEQVAEEYHGSGHGDDPAGVGDIRRFQAREGGGGAAKGVSQKGQGIADVEKAIGVDVAAAEAVLDTHFEGSHVRAVAAGPPALPQMMQLAISILPQGGDCQPGRMAADPLPDSVQLSSLSVAPCTYSTAPEVFRVRVQFSRVIDESADGTAPKLHRTTVHPLRTIEASLAL